MKNSPFRMLFLALFWVLLVMPVTNFAQDQPKRPPEYEEYRKALRMPDPESALKEINGNMEEFDRMLEAKLSELPFHPEPFKLIEDWNGKTVLAELFTGTECPPCAAADLAFDALLEAYDSKYLLVLKYHLPIPGPDPMMNSATLRRQSFYNVTSTPTTFFDGIMRHKGGGSRSDAKRKYDQYISSINPVVGSTPQAQLTVSAVLEGDNVKVTWSSDDSLKDINYNFVLVQSEERYVGRSGILIHKMVVRDVKTLTKKFALASEKNSEVIFNVNATEKYAENLLKDYEKRRRFRFKELRHKIDRTQLKVVFFLQHKDSQIVYNAIDCDVVLK